MEPPDFPMPNSAFVKPFEIAPMVVCGADGESYPCESRTSPGLLIKRKPSAAMLRLFCVVGSYMGEVKKSSAQRIIHLLRVGLNVTEAQLRSTLSASR